ncbi:MAG: polyphosphate polymerase domain-containing protein, partial [Candidatus Eremiobacteraeota bacterium]|nr:polyphosphate polymerase domain-containing protein [Candidatus Eremiobacteraeota bacterium]
MQRYELKFLVDAQVKARLLQAAAPGLVDDPNGDQGVYRVTSQYFDSAQHTALTEKLDGVALRRKLRLRFYGLAPARAYHLEIKARHNNLVSKHRLPLVPESVPALVEDSAWNLPRLHQFTDVGSLTVDERYLLAAIELQAAQQKLQATAVITYLREAWIGRYDTSLRVTFDHQC